MYVNCVFDVGSVVSKVRKFSVLAGALIVLGFTTTASAAVYTYTFGDRIDTQGNSDFGPATPGDFATLLFDDVTKQFTLSLINPAFSTAFPSGAYVDDLAVNYNDGAQGNPSPVTASAISGGVSAISANSSTGPYSGSDPFTWGIGNGANRLTNGESVTWTASGLDNSWLVNYNPPILTGDGTFALHVNRSGDGVETNSWYRATLVTAVPEPETYAMMLAGLGLMGFVVRRRNNRI
jgi:hypothetical protein